MMGTPPPRDAWYVARKAQEAKLEQLLGDVVHEHKKVAVMGPGGAGKTTMTLNYAVKHKTR